MDLSLVWVIAILFGGVIVMIASGMWVGLAIGLVGILSLMYIVKTPELMGDIMWNTLTSYVLAAVPFYIFMGEIVLRSGLSANLYRGVSRWTIIVPGGLIHSNIISAAIFAAISGSSVATVATIGSVAFPEQDRRNYNRRMIAGSLTAGGTLGPMIPPSIGMIMFGSLTNTSVGSLFMGTAIPGIIMAVIFMGYIFTRYSLNSSLGPRREPLTRSYFREAIFAFNDIWPVAILILIIFVGIYGGFMTPTEAAAISGFVAMCLAAFFRKINLNIIKEASFSALRVTAMIMLIIVSAKILAFVMSMLTVPRQLCALAETSGLTPLAIWGLLILLYLFLGCFLDATSMMVLTISVAFPLMTSLGFDPIWFGVILGITLETGLLTPPVGMNLFVCQGVTKQPFAEVVKGSFPFFGLMLINIALVTFFPQLATWLPSTMR